MNQKLKLRSENSEPACALVANGIGDVHGVNAIARLRLLIAELIREVELIEHGNSCSVEMLLRQTDGEINFYQEVSRFEIEIIKTALHRTRGNQRRAARLLNLKTSTLNGKVKQYDILGGTDD